MTMILTVVRKNLGERAAQMHDRLLWELCCRRDPGLPAEPPTSTQQAIELLGGRLTGRLMPATGWTYWSLDDRPLVDIGPYEFDGYDDPRHSPGPRYMHARLNYRVHG